MKFGTAISTFALALSLQTTPVGAITVVESTAVIKNTQAATQRTLQGSGATLGTTWDEYLALLAAAGLTLIRLNGLSSRSAGGERIRKLS